MAGRLVAAALLAWMAWIHLHLWSAGYKHLHVVGPLFMLNFVAGVGVALAVVAVPRRWVSLAASAGIFVVVATLIGLYFSLHGGLFGFKDSVHAPFVELSIWVESAGALVLAALAVRTALLVRPVRAGRPLSRRPPSAESSDTAPRPPD